MKYLNNKKLRAEEIRRLKNLNLGNNQLEFLGITVKLDSEEVYDQLSKETLRNERDLEIIQVLLAHYSRAEPKEKTGRLVKFRELPGGYAYEKTFNQSVTQPIAETFGDEPQALFEAAKPLSGIPLPYGDSSVEIPALKGIPIVYILWRPNEFPATATTLFDKSASSYLPTEDLAVLAELTTRRLEQSWVILKKH